MQYSFHERHYVKPRDGYKEKSAAVFALDIVL